MGLQIASTKAINKFTHPDIVFADIGSQGWKYFELFDGTEEKIFI